MCHLCSHPIGWSLVTWPHLLQGILGNVAWQAAQEDEELSGDEQLEAFASNAFDIKQGFVPDKNSLSKVRNISENFPKSWVVCLVRCPGDPFTDSRPHH